jgi:hypothetical protein
MASGCLTAQASWQPDAGAFAVLVDEDHFGGFERGADRGQVARRWSDASVLEVSDDVARDDSPTRQFGLIHVDQPAGSAALGGRDRHEA